jgi:hypothetical protein
MDHHGELGSLLSVVENLDAGRYDVALRQSYVLGSAFAAKFPY